MTSGVGIDKENQYFFGMSCLSKGTALHLSRSYIFQYNLETLACHEVKRNWL